MNSMIKINLVFLFIFGLLIEINAQDTLIVKGLISNNNGIPIQVHITIDANSSHSQNSAILSDSTGHYIDSFIVNYSQGSVSAWIVSCNGDTIVGHGGYYSNHMTLAIDLDHCPIPANSCTALFSKVQAFNNHQPIPYLIHIIDHSNGNNLIYKWHFGDGDSSIHHSPTHTYAGHGPYILCLTVSNAHCTSHYCDTLNIDTNGILKSGQGFTIVVGGNITGISKNNNKNSPIKIYPNPVENELFLDNPEDVRWTNLRILSSSGKEVLYTEKIQNSISLTELNSGFYIIQVTDDKGTMYHGKFLKN